MSYRLDPLDEALRLWRLLTTPERVAFLAAVAADPQLEPEPAASTSRGSSRARVSLLTPRPPAPGAASA